MHANALMVRFMRESYSVSVEGVPFFFFSREEDRVHVHVYCADGEAKLWIEPEVEVVRSHGLSATQQTEVVRTVREHRDEIARAWSEHFGS